MDENINETNFFNSEFSFDVFHAVNTVNTVIDH